MTTSHRKSWRRPGGWRCTILASLVWVALAAPGTAHAAMLLTGDYLQVPIAVSGYTGQLMNEAQNQGVTFNPAGTGGASGIDFWKWGSPVYNYTVRTDGTLRSNGAGWFVAPVVTNTSAGSVRSALIVGKPTAALRFERALSFEKTGRIIRVVDTLTNEGAATITGVATLDNTDPDQGYPLASNYNTNNDVLSATTADDIVVAAYVGGAYPGGLTIGFGSTDSRVTVDASGFSNTNPASILSAPQDPNGASGDIGINLVVDYGSIGAGEVRTATWFMTFGSTQAQAVAGYAGAQCGNGVVGSGEQCDDGNLVGGDCCSSTCQFESAGSACADDGNGCTDDECDGAGTCDPVANTSACSDGNVCTTGDICGSGVCTSGTLVTSCADGDGCCIPGCTASQDTDCPALAILDYVSTIVDDSIDPMGGVNGLYSGTDLAVSPDGKHIYVSARVDNAIGVFARDAVTGEASWVEAELGASSALSRVNTVAVSPDGEHVYAGNEFFASSGVSLFNRNPATGALTYVTVYRQAGMDSVSQVTVSPDGANLYAVSFSNLLVTYSRNATTGALTIVQTLADGVDGVEGLSNPKDVVVSPDGAHVYVASVDDNAVSIFERDAGTGALTFLSVVVDNTPGIAFLHRAFGVAVSSDGEYLYATSFDEDLNVFHRDQETGELAFVEHFPEAGGPALLAVSPDDGRIFVSSWSVVLDVFGRDVATGTHDFLETRRDGIDGVDGLDGIQGVAVSPDGLDVYTGSLNDRALTHFRVRCGDGVLDVGEGCDDANGAGGDGCASDCTVEFCWTCTAAPLAQSVCSPDDGKVCNDGLYCTGAGGDACQAGVCTGPERSCDDAVQCTLDLCDETANACSNVASVLDGASCEDGLYCTVGDSCLGGVCVTGPARDCDDGEDCTIDACDDGGDQCTNTVRSDGASCSSGATCTVAETCLAGICQGGDLDAASCADNYLCYKALSTKGTTAFAGITALPLEDAFESVDTDLKKPKGLCLATDKDGEGIRYSDTHVEAYQAKTSKGQPSHVPQLGLSVTDRFGNLTVDLLKPSLLLAPSAIASGVDAQPLSRRTTDHFKCYKIKVSAGSAGLPSGTQTTLENELMTGPTLFDVKKPKALCIPTDKDGDGLVEPLANLMCYQVKPAPDAAAHGGLEGVVHVTNDFGQEQLDTKKEDVLCVPALVNPAP